MFVMTIPECCALLPLQEIGLESTIRLAWFDKRIKAKINKSIDENYVIVNRNPVEHFWFPDIFISKAKELRKPYYKIPPSYLRVHEDGKMVYSARVNFDLSCPMKFKRYPVSGSDKRSGKGFLMTNSVPYNVSLKAILV